MKAQIVHLWPSKKHKKDYKMFKEQDIILLNTWEALKEFINNTNYRDSNVFVKDNSIVAHKSNLYHAHEEQPKWAAIMERRIFDTLNKIDSRLTNVENKLDNVIRVNNLKTE